MVRHGRLTFSCFSLIPPWPAQPDHGAELRHPGIKTTRHVEPPLEPRSCGAAAPVRNREQQLTCVVAQLNPLPSACADRATSGL